MYTGAGSNPATFTKQNKHEYEEKRNNRSARNES